MNYILDRVLSYIRNNKRSSSKGELAFSHTNIRNEDTTRDNYMCYRCKHFLEIPHNLSRPFNDRVPTFVEQCKTELSFVQAIVWLKSSIACVSQIPVKQLQQIFNRQWSGKHNHREDKHNDVEQLESSMDENLSICERTNTRDIATSTPLRKVSGVPCVTPQRTICGSYTRSDDIQSKLLSSANNSNESSFESLILELSSSITATGKEKETLRSRIIPETSAESILNEDLDMFDDISEQCLEYEKGTGYSVQGTSKDDTQQINKKIIENKDFFQKSYADIPNEHKSISPTRSQSIGSMFDLECNFNGKCSSSARRQYDLDDKILKIDDSPKTFVITPKIVSQMSDIHEFEFPFDDNSPWQASNTVAESWNKDSAYSSISQIDTFNYDTIVKAGSITGNKRMPETQHYYELQPCKKKTIMYEKGKVSSFCSTNETLAPDGSPKSFIITQKDISQMSNVYNDANSEFESPSNSWRMSNNISESSKGDTAVAAESIVGNKRTLNIEHKLHPCNKKTIMYKKGKASSSYSTNRTLAFDGSPKSFIITQKDISQMSNEENSEFESPSFWRMSNNIFESLKDDTALAAESIIGNKHTPNIEHKLHPCNEKTITSEKIMASPSILHGAVIPDINTKHRYNLRLRNKSSSCKKEASSSIIGGPKEHKSGRAWNLSEKRKRKKENENEDKMLSANWLNFTLKSLRMESVIFASIKTILSTLCEKRTAEKYAICTYWKGSLEEEAVNAILNISDIFTIENKPNICIKAIVMEIIKTLNEMTRAQFNKTYQPQVYYILHYTFFYIYKYYIK